MGDDEDDEEDDEWEGETDYDIDWDYGVRGEHLEEEELLSGGEGIQADVPACESLEDLDMVLKADSSSSGPLTGVDTQDYPPSSTSFAKKIPI